MDSSRLDDAARPGFLERSRAALIGTSVGLALGVALAGWVWFDRTAELRATEADCEARTKLAAEARVTLQEDVAAVEERLASQTALGGVLRARVLLGRAVDAIDQTNFGTAQERVEEANAILQGAAGTTTELDQAALAELTADVEAVDIRVGTRVGIQRQALVALAERLDDLLDP